MKFISINFLLTILTIINVHAQKHIELEPNGGGESIIKNNHVCISDNERISIIKSLQENIDKYQLRGSKSKSLTSDFLWPLSKKSELDFYNYFALSNFVDHDNSEEILLPKQVLSLEKKMVSLIKIVSKSLVLHGMRFI